MIVLCELEFIVVVSRTSSVVASTVPEADCVLIPLISATKRFAYTFSIHDRKFSIPTSICRTGFLPSVTKP